MKIALARCRESAAALIIILALIILVTALVVAYFSRAMSERQVSNSSVSQTKTELLARGALDSIVGDLQQEIAAGSVNTTITTGTVSSVIRIPVTPFTAVPALSGTTAVVAFPPNLIKVSAYNAPFFSGTYFNVSNNTVTTNGTTNVSTTGAYGSPSRASIASTSGTSANGRTISLARWNKPLLLPRQNLSSTTDFTPASPATTGTGFVAPNWILVARSGSNAAISAYNPNMAMSSANSTTIVGRYAYAIYDEGGLLDMNVAGSPSSVSGTQSGYKGSLAFADLTQVGLTQLQIDAIVGWRNYATAQPSGSFPNFSYSGTSYYNYVIGNTSGFLTVGNQSLFGGQSDRMFSSRQQLINLLETTGSLGGNTVAATENALQYLGNFSRDLEQPSFVPNPNRTLIQSGTFTNSNSFGTGNDAYKLDRYGTTGQPAGTSIGDINPPFPEVRVTGTFARSDGTTAQVGESLVKKRFPLSRLSLLVTGTIAVQSQSDPIYRNFGLYRSSGTGPWLYNHGNSTGILRLSQVTGRDPDFFELLKAAVNIGSLGKGACLGTDLFSNTDAGSVGDLQQLHDVLTALQTLQIGANIIDQAKPDGFPTRIQFAGDNTKEVRGIEDLPYLYRVRDWVTRTSATGGELLLQPELWDPHSIGSSPTGTGVVQPVNFRVRVARDPTSVTVPITLNTTYSSPYTSDFSNLVAFNDPNSPPPPLTFTFNAGPTNGFWPIREPTLLSQVGIPAAINLQGGSPSPDFPVATHPNPNNETTGILVGTFSWTNPQVSGTTDTVQKVIPSHLSTTSNSCLHFYLEYEDASGNWITYDDEPFQFDGKSFTTKGTSQALQEISVNDWYGVGRTDPRSERWGWEWSEAFTSFPVVDISNNEYGTYRPDGGISYGDHVGGRSDNGFYTISGYKSANWYKGVQYGYWTENSIRPTYQNQAYNDPGDTGLRFHRDPDGVIRRAMGGYWSDTTNGGYSALSGTSSSTPVVGLPMATGNYGSRPTILHRPFRSVGELGYAFRDTPWSDLNFSFPESADSALLDVFCVNECTDPNGLVAGRVDLNTRQAPVIQALLSGALRDKDDSTNPTLTGTMVTNLAAQLVTRTTSIQPLVNRADVVGTWDYNGTWANAASALVSGSDPNLYYTGFSADIGTLAGISGTPVALTTRQREAAIRALVDEGTTRVWNLMIDLIAQSGHYTSGAQNLDNFTVDGESRYWLHIAIDRYTGTVLDTQLEIVKE